MAKLKAEFPTGPKKEPYELDPDVVAAQEDFTARQKEADEAHDAYVKICNGDTDPKKETADVRRMREVRDALGAIANAARHRLEEATHHAAEAHLKKTNQQNHENPSDRAAWREEKFIPAQKSESEARKVLKKHDWKGRG